jgi:hypothetical protein
LFEVLDGHLAGNEYLAGDYSIATSPMVVGAYLRMAGHLSRRLDHLQRWMAAIAARPAVAKGRAVPPRLRKPPPWKARARSWRENPGPPCFCRGREGGAEGFHDTQRRWKVAGGLWRNPRQEPSVSLAGCHPPAKAEEDGSRYESRANWSRISAVLQPGASDMLFA